MVGPDDLPPVSPYERYASEEALRARWTCPRCECDNTNFVAERGTTPCICRSCFQAINVLDEVKVERLAWRFGKTIQSNPRFEG